MAFLKTVQLCGVPLFGVVFCVVVVGQEKQSKKCGKGIGVHAQWHLDCWRVLVGTKLSRACVDTSAFPLAQQLRCVTIEMSRFVCASTCTTRIHSMLFPVYSFMSFSSCSVQNCHVLHLDCQPSTACHSLLSLPNASC